MVYEELAELRTPIRLITRHDWDIRVIGKVIQVSGPKDWSNDEGSGKRVFFDLKDNTGIIRVFAWDDIASAAVKRMSSGLVVELRNFIINKRNKVFNNTPHKCEIRLTHYSEIIKAKSRDIKPLFQEKVRFVAYSDVPKFRENQYFSVTGQIFEICSPFKGIGPRGNEYKGQKIFIMDDFGDLMTVISWDGYIPLSRKDMGKTLKLIRCKYIPEYDNIDSSGARILINGKRVGGG